MSSTIATKHIDWSKYGVVYAGLKKQVGTTGIYLTVVRDDLIGNHRPDTPNILEWEGYARDTTSQWPSVWSLYMCGLNLEYMLSQGGINEMDAKAKMKSELLYACIDESKGYYVNSVEPLYRSRINVPFKITNGDELEGNFLKQAAEASLYALHKNSLGGIRANLYNSTSFADTYALIDFMQKFMTENPKKK
jgi:phosphoserine aminotransferase